MIKLPTSLWFAFSGSLLGIGFVISPFWPLSFIGVWMFFTALETAPSWQSRFSGAFLAFSIKALCGIAWFWSVYPIDWLSIPVSVWQLPAIGVGWFVSGVALGSGGLLLALLVSGVRRYPSLYSGRFIFYALGWVGAEVFGSFIFSLVTYGPGGTITTAFSFGYIGYLTAHIPLFFAVASFGGVYGVTVVTILAVLVGAYSLTHWHGIRRSFVVGVSFGIIIVSWLGTGPVIFNRLSLSSTSTTPTATVALVDTSFSATLRQSEAGQATRQKALTEALKAARASEATYIIFPEDSGFMTGLDSGLAFALINFRHQLQSGGVVLVDSGSVPTPDGVFLRATIFDGLMGASYELDKQYLVPVGEFVPTHIITPLFTALGWGSIFTTLEQSVRYRPGPHTALKADLTHIPGILFCFEGVSPKSVKKLRTRRPVPFIAHPFSHGWFQSTTRLTPQLTMMLRLQARANQISIVSAGNQGTGAVYLPSGQRYVPPVYAEGDLWRVRVATIPLVRPTE